MFPESEILFPYRAIAPLRKERGDVWQDLVNRVASQKDGSEDIIAFSLMMIRLCDCLNCDQSSYKASLGCISCARRTVAAAKVSDTMMVQAFEQSRQEVRERGIIPARHAASYPLSDNHRETAGRFTGGFPSRRARDYSSSPARGFSHR
jgi:hypothetical protein